MNISLPQQQRMEYDDGEDSGNDEPPTDHDLEPALDQHKNHYHDYQSIPRSVAIEYYKQLREMTNEQRRNREAENTELATLIQILSHPAEVRNPNISDVEIGALPVEVLIHIFSYLDDISLWVVSEVSKQWKEIVEINSPEPMWKRSLRERWPLFVNKVEVKSWFKVSFLFVSFYFIDRELILMFTGLSFDRVLEASLKAKSRIRSSSLFLRFQIL